MRGSCASSGHRRSVGYAFQPRRSAAREPAGRRDVEVFGESLRDEPPTARLVRLSRVALDHEGLDCRAPVADRRSDRPAARDTGTRRDGDGLEHRGRPPASRAPRAADGSSRSPNGRRADGRRTHPHGRRPEQQLARACAECLTAHPVHRFGRLHTGRMHEPEGPAIARSPSVERFRGSASRCGSWTRANPAAPSRRSPATRRPRYRYAREQRQPPAVRRTARSCLNPMAGPAHCDPHEMRPRAASAPSSRPRARRRPDRHGRPARHVCRSTPGWRRRLGGVGGRVCRGSLGDREVLPGVVRSSFAAVVDADEIPARRHRGNTKPDPARQRRDPSTRTTCGRPWSASLRADGPVTATRGRRPGPCDPGSTTL